MACCLVVDVELVPLAWIGLGFLIAEMINWWRHSGRTLPSGPAMYA